MAANQFTKQTYEEFVIEADFSANLITGEIINSQFVSAKDKDGTDVTSTILDINTLANDGASKVSILVRAGSVSASPYKITLRCITNHAIPHKWEMDITMRVKEI